MGTHPSFVASALRRARAAASVAKDHVGPGLVTASMLLLLASPVSGGSSWLQQGRLSVEVNDRGVLVTALPGGLRTVDGPRVELPAEVEEWFGVYYRDAADEFALAGSGREPDPAGRTEVEPIEFRSSGSRARSVTRHRSLEIRTDLELDSFGLLLVHVELANTGSTILRDVCYTREWRLSDGEGWTFPYDIRGLGTVPDDIRRHAWMTDDLPPGQSRGLTFSYLPTGAPDSNGRGGAVDVPLSLWTNAAYPAGVPVGETNGVSWGDYDADGFIDMFACESANLWRNLGGTSWELAADLDAVLPATGRRYGSSFGDYDSDGLPDIGTEPREGFGGDEDMQLLRNLGGGPNFENVAEDPAIIDVQPTGDSETLCWGDVDGDADLDAFLPVYPAWAGGGPGNFFLRNLGPTGPGGAYRFTEMVDAAGLDNPLDSARPEGAQFVDVDFDGDLDLYSNGTLYQNVSTNGNPLFRAQTALVSGIFLSQSLDEGAAFADYDLDGDWDLLIAYASAGVKVWESRGDGTFFEAPGVVESPFTGLNLGLSAEDWDNDGDVDFTTRQVFRRNMLMEEGTRHFAVATTSIPGSHLTSATPAWGDWDTDGDLDCALGNWLSVGHFYENTLYDASTQDSERRFVRVRIVDDSPLVPGGLETAYGAVADVRILDPSSDGFVRRKFTASSHGYLNQNEYTLHFALPDDPFPLDPNRDLRFDLVVDFPSLPSEGGWRVDKYVQPALAAVDLAQLDDREIRVYRSGKSVVDGVEQFPASGVTPALLTTTGGLALPTDVSPLPAPQPSPSEDWYVGLAFNTFGAEEPVRVKEIVLDGQLDLPLDCGGTPFNVSFWDVTDGFTPVPGGMIAAETSDRNRRSYLPVDLVLPPGRDFKVVARVTRFRRTDIVTPDVTGPVEVTGGMSFSPTDGCSGASVAAIPPLPDRAYLALRFSTTPGSVSSVASDPDPPPASSSGALLGSRPNPFRGSTEIAYRIDAASDVRIEVFDPAGRRIRTLRRTAAPAGRGTLVWDGRDASDREAPAGVYVYATWSGERRLGTGRVLRIR